MPRGLYQRAVGQGGKGLGKFLGDLELDVLRLVWGHGEATVREIRSALSRRRPLAYTTIMTVMVRLTDKGLLRRRKLGRAFLYSTKRTREELAADLAGDVARALVADFGDMAIVQFVKEVASVDPAALARLAELARAEEPDGDT